MSAALDNEYNQCTCNQLINLTLTSFLDKLDFMEFLQYPRFFIVLQSFMESFTWMKCQLLMRRKN